MLQTKEKLLRSAELKINFKQVTGMNAKQYAILKGLDWRSLLNVLSLNYTNRKYGHKMTKVIETLKSDGIWDEKYSPRTNKNEEVMQLIEKNRKEFSILGIEAKDYARKNDIPYYALQRVLACEITRNSNSKYRYIIDQLEKDGVRVA